MKKIMENSNNSNHCVNNSTKRESLSLDFTKPRHLRNGQQPYQQQPPSLVTPLLNLSTPELNKIITNSDMIDDEVLTVLTPNGISSIIPQSNGILPSPLIPTTVNNSNNIVNNVTNNNNSLGNQNHLQNPNLNTSNNSINANNNNINSNNNHQNQVQNQKFNHSVLKKENHNNSNSTNHSKSTNRDLMDTEKIEKKRERNRLAAKKCRQRKLETIDELRKTVSEIEQKHERLKLQHGRLQDEYERLQIENMELKNQLLRQ